MAGSGEAAPGEAGSGQVGPGRHCLGEGGFAAAVDAVGGHLCDRAGLARLDADALRRRLGLLRRLEGATTAAVANTVAALDRVGGVEADGAPSKAEWLKANTGRSGRESARLQRLADNLDELPATANALAAGDLSAESADAIVRASRDGRIGSPEAAEAALLPVATKASPEDLRRHIKRRQQAADGAALLRDETRQRALRRLSLSQRDHGGMWELHGQLSNEVGVKLRTALDAFDHRDPSDAPFEQRRSHDKRLADALGAMTDTLLDGGMTPATGGIARPHISVIVDLDTVAADLARPGENGPVAPDDRTWAGLPPGETAWGSLLSPQSVHRLLCDASVSRIVMAGGSQVVDVGRAHRDWTEPQRRAINVRDRGCRGPNCSLPFAWTNIHHVAWWNRDQGPTNLDNGLALCHHCHHLVHEGGWTVRLGPTTAHATWTGPDGRTIVTRPQGALERRMSKEPNSPQQGRDPRDPHDFRALNDPREPHEPHESHEPRTPRTPHDPRPPGCGDPPPGGLPRAGPRQPRLDDHDDVAASPGTARRRP